MNTAVIIYGPQGCGKTSYARRLAQHYGKTRIIDDASSGELKKLPHNVLALTSEIPVGVPFIHADQAFKEIGVKSKTKNK